MKTSPKGLRLHIGFYGRRNVGKSSLLNALTRQYVSIVSDIAGTTTDPVEKPMELLPIGPVLFIDTAGIDDEGALGELRMNKTLKTIQRTDIGIIVTGEGVWGQFEEALLSEFQKKNIQVIVVFNKDDLGKPSEGVLKLLDDKKVSYLLTDALHGRGINDLRQALIKSAPDEFINPPSLISDLVPPGELAILVIPIDTEAPKGRLILPQVQTIRDLLDNDSYCIVVKERELKHAIDRLKKPPALVVTDSQAFLKVAADTPKNVPMTSFSILFARYKGDLNEFVRGACAIDSLKTGDKVLIAEACTHHPIGDDIGRVKIPRWLTQYAGGKIEFITYQGHDFPDNLADYKLVIHCGSCMTNRREVLSRILKCREAGVPITNYGITIALTLGIIERALQPFPSALELYKELKSS